MCSIAVAWQRAHTAEPCEGNVRVERGNFRKVYTHHSLPAWCDGSALGTVGCKEGTVLKETGQSSHRLKIFGSEKVPKMVIISKEYSIATVYIVFVSSLERIFQVYRKS